MKHKEFENLINLYNEIFQAMQNMVYDNSDVLHRHKLTLFCVIIENTKSIIDIFEQGLNETATVITRNSLEAIIDLLFVDEKSVEGYKAIYLAFQYSNRNAFNAQKEILLNAGHSKIELQAAIDNINTDIEKQKIDGVRPYNIKEKCTAINNTYLYDCFYKLLCATSHNSLQSLEDRFIDNVAGTFKVTMTKPLHPNRIELILQTNISMLLKGYSLLLKEFEFNMPEINNTLYHELITQEKYTDLFTPSDSSN
ncbi:MAG: DUF5677 domain-containing protein [Fibrobacterales bacterium]